MEAREEGIAKERTTEGKHRKTKPSWRKNGIASFHPPTRTQHVRHDDIRRLGELAKGEGNGPRERKSSPSSIS